METIELTYKNPKDEKYTIVDGQHRVNYLIAISGKTLLPVLTFLRKTQP